MLRYSHTYRSPFNGPRWGALLTVILIIAVQMTSAFHVPDNEMDARHLHGDAYADHHHDEVPASKTHIHGEFQHQENGAHSSDADSASDCEDDCDSACTDASCSDCCHHIPMVSPLPVPLSLAFNFASPYTSHAQPSLLNNSIPAPFQPPRA
ncbi:MAG: hypothetical protein C0600_06160 [Ignavibacteria bacterium]|nr:MAG: hypothetical protein C0600_06160 [Ignavibacteria bacterium]